MTNKTETLKLALEAYMAAFGQALDANGIAYGQQQVDADKQSREALAQPAQDSTRPCRSCGGTGERHTGVDESPTTICKPCDGTGQIAIAAQPEQEPVAWLTPDGEGFRIRFSAPTSEVPLGWDALYTAPPKREWVGLTDDDIFKAILPLCDTPKLAQSVIDMSMDEYQAIEVKLKEKNHDNKN